LTFTSAAASAAGKKLRRSGKKAAGRKIKVLVGAMLLNVLGKVSGGDVCSYQQPLAHPTGQDNWMSSLYWITVVACFWSSCIFFVGVYYGRATVPRALETPRVFLQDEPRAQKARTMATQSQTKYTWWHASSRFVPLGDRDHGAWQA
jgi:hypothetical protein